MHVVVQVLSADGADAPIGLGPAAAPIGLDPADARTENSGASRDISIDSGGDRGGTSDNVIVGVAVGCASLLVLAIVAFLVIRRRRGQKLQQQVAVYLGLLLSQLNSAEPLLHQQVYLWSSPAQLMAQNLWATFLDLLYLVLMKLPWQKAAELELSLPWCL